jgi:hypothetical protein
MYNNGGNSQLEILSKKEKMVGTAGFFGTLFARNSAEPATDGYLQTTTEAVAHYSPLLCQISQRSSKRHSFELRPESGLASSISR